MFGVHCWWFKVHKIAYEYTGFFWSFSSWFLAISKLQYMVIPSMVWNALQQYDAESSSPLLSSKCCCHPNVGVPHPHLQLTSSCSLHNAQVERLEMKSCLSFDVHCSKSSWVALFPALNLVRVVLLCICPRESLTIVCIKLKMFFVVIIWWKNSSDVQLSISKGLVGLFTSFLSSSLAKLALVTMTSRWKPGWAWSWVLQSWLSESQRLHWRTLMLSCCHTMYAQRWYTLTNVGWIRLTSKASCPIYSNLHRDSNSTNEYVVACCSHLLLCRSASHRTFACHGLSKNLPARCSRLSNCTHKLAPSHARPPAATGPHTGQLPEGSRPGCQGDGGDESPGADAVISEGIAS